MKEWNTCFFCRFFIPSSISNVTRSLYLLPFNDRTYVFVLKLSCATKTLTISEEPSNGSMIKKNLKVAFTAITYDEYAK